MSDDRGFKAEPDPDNPGWHRWLPNDSTRFNSWMFARMLVRAEPDGKARLRVYPEHHHTNLADNIHGGTVLALIDIGLFACSRMLGIIEAGTAVTIDLSVQFVGAGKPGQPCDAVTELLKETRRLVFLRGVVEQGEGNLIAAYSGTIRKPTSPKK
jgi:uncharacterized protein (TIGR00369 family)